MKKWLPAIILFVSGACTCRDIYAQDLTFSFYNASNGLPSSEIISLAQDEQGFLWIGTTAGISRYDGYTFSNYQYSRDDHFIGMINMIEPVSTREIWIAASSGLYCYTQNGLIKISAETTSPQGVNDIVAEPAGNLWLATENGPAFIPKKDIDTTGIKKIVLEKYVLSQWRKKNAAIDDRRTILVEKALDGSIFTAQNAAIYRISGNSIDSVFSLAEKNDVILSLFPVNKNKIYFDCAKSEINKIDNGVWSLINFQTHYKPGLQTTGKAYWYTGTAGVFCFQPGSEVISTFINTTERKFLWPSSLLKDGNIFWLGTHDGLVKLKPSVFNNYADKKYDDVRETYSFVQLQNNDFLIGTNRGKLWKKSENSFTYYLPGEERMVPLAEVKCLYEDERGWLWAGTGYQGIAVYRNGKIMRFTKEENGLHDNTIEFLLKTKSGKFFGIGDQGLSEILIDDAGNISFRKYYYLPNMSMHAKFYSGIEGPDGAIWVAGEEGIRFLKNDSLQDFELLNKTVSAKSIRMAADSSVWIATTGKGILHCFFDSNNKLKIVKQYQEQDGLNTLLFIDILIDRQDNIWAASAKGLTFIGRSGKYKGRVLNFDEADGFIKAGYSSIRLYQDKDGVIWAGTTLGITSFKPGELFLSTDHPKVYITGINLTKTNTAVQNTDPVFALNDHTASPFSYNNNSFNFAYTAIDFANQQSLVYYYKLDGVDSSWINGGNNRNITFQNLSPGKYTFRVKALNDKGLWSEREAVYVFSIAPAFWQTWWFRVLSLLFATSIVFAFIKRKEKIATKREAEKTGIEKLKAISYQYQLEIEQVINFFATSINQQNSIDDMLWDVAKNCISKLGFEDCVIYLLDEKRNVLVQKAAWGPKTSEEDKIVNPIEIVLGSGIVGHVALRGKAEINNDTSGDERYIIDDANRLSEITVPIRNDKKVLGIIDSEHSQKDFYTDRHLKILTTIASLLADKIDKMKAEQLTREKEVEVLKLNKDLATWQITALRAQMNPHFIFNAMNSIQQFTLMNDTDNANLYISKFSTLLRKVLHTSEQNSISLEEEMEQLQLYLDIEKLRMGESFVYSIGADEEIETDALKMPGMLVQPFVENAVKHGLALKDGERKLTIYFYMPDEYYLTAVITDNGIGRQRSEKIKQQQKLMPHVSKGIQLVKERLQLLEQNKDHHSSISIEDLPNGTGTKVTLVIPIC